MHIYLYLFLEINDFHQNRIYHIIYDHQSYVLRIIQYDIRNNVNLIPFLLLIIKIKNKMIFFNQL